MTVGDTIYKVSVTDAGSAMGRPLVQLSFSTEQNPAMPSFSDYLKEKFANKLGFASYLHMPEGLR